MRLIRNLVTGFALILSFNAQALTIVVDTNSGGSGGPDCSLADAIIAANTGSTSAGCSTGSNGADEIVFNSNLSNNAIVLTADLPVITGDLDIIGTAGQISVSGDNLYSIFVVEGVRLNLFGLRLLEGNGKTDSTIIGGFVNNGGALAAISGAFVTVNDTTFTNNSAFWGGGAIFAEDDSFVELNNSRVVNNHAYQRGGGVAAVDAQISVQNSLVLNNTASRGGGIWLTQNATTSIINSQISNNVGTLKAGAIFSEAGGAVDIVESELLNNSSGAPYIPYQSFLGGGAIAVSGAELNVLNSTIAGNNSFHSGGAIHAHSGAQISLNSVFLLDNSSTNSGGAIYTESNLETSITRSFIANNTTNDSGGAIHALNNAVVTLNGSTLSNNTADIKGGAIFADDSNVGFTNSTVSSNNSGEEGGAVYANNGAVLELNNSTFAENIGGSVFAFNSSEAVLRNTVLADGHCDLDSSSNVLLNGGVHIDDGTCGATSFGPSQLAGLDYYGGNIPTHAPIPGSPLIDHGVAGGNPATDQRGSNRVVGIAIDIGSVELSDPPIFDNYNFSALIGSLTVGQSIFIDLEDYITDKDSSKFKVTVRGLPRGLRLDSVSNVLSGAPIEAGEFEMEYTIEDDTGNQIKVTVETTVTKSKR